MSVVNMKMTRRALNSRGIRLQRGDRTLQRKYVPSLDKADLYQVK